jgi:hypothetical protein
MLRERKKNNANQHFKAFDCNLLYNFALYQPVRNKLRPVAGSETAALLSVVSVSQVNSSLSIRLNDGWSNS